MHKDSKIYQELIKSWKEGWRDYIYIPSADNKPLLELAYECARILKVDLDEGNGYTRVMIALKNIGGFCSNHKDWRDKNVYSINQAISTIMQQMQAAKKAAAEAEHENNVMNRIYQADKSNRAAAERMMAEQSAKLKREHEKTWTAEDQAGYERYMKSIQPGKVISIELGKEKSVNKAINE